MEPSAYQTASNCSKVNTTLHLNSCMLCLLVAVYRYLDRPFLINESKFDLRVYVYVSSYDPLRIYVFKDGLARFATCK